MTRGKLKSNQGLITSTEERLKKDLILVNNPVLIEGLALTPIIGAALNLRNAVILSVMVPILLVPTRFIGNILVGIVPQKLRIMVYSIIATILYIPGVIAVTRLFGIRATTLGIYLPMLVVDSIITSRTEVPNRESVFSSLFGGILSCIGFALAAVLVGATREILGFGHIWGKTIIEKAPLPIFSTVAGGLIIACLCCAAFQYLVSAIKRAKYRYAKDSWYKKS